MRQWLGAGVLCLTTLMSHPASASTITLGFGSGSGTLFALNAVDSLSDVISRKGDHVSHGEARGLVRAQRGGAEERGVDSFVAGAFSDARLAEEGAGHFSEGSPSGYDPVPSTFGADVVARGMLPYSANGSAPDSGGAFTHLSNVGYGGSDLSFIDMLRRGYDGLALSLTFAKNRSHRNDEDLRSGSGAGNAGRGLEDPPVDSASAPEPASMLLLGTGLIGLGSAARRQSRRKSG